MPCSFSLCQNIIHELNQASYYLIAQIQLVVDFMAIAAISLYRCTSSEY